MLRKFIKTHKTKLASIFMAALMVVFILPSNRSGNPQADTVRGKLAGRKVTMNDFLIAHDEWQMLLRIPYYDEESQFIRISAAEALFIDWDRLDQMDRLSRYYALQRQVDAAKKIVDKQITPQPDDFFLLVQEAKQQQVHVDEDMINTFLHSHIGALPSDYDAGLFHDAVADGLLVKGLLGRLDNMVKVSRPRLDLLDAQRQQQMTLDVALLPATTFMDKVAAPTDAEIKTQFDLYADKYAASYDKGNPLGFGYKYPNRVKLQWIGVKYGDVRRAAIELGPEPQPDDPLPANPQSAKLSWMGMAVDRYKNKDNRAKYDAMQVATTLPSTTQPSTQPDTPIAAPPAVRTSPDINADFRLHADVVLNDLYDEAANRNEDLICKKIGEWMASDYDAWHKAQSTPSTQPSSSVGPVYNSEEYIVQLRQKVAETFHIAPAYQARAGQLKNAEELGKIDDIGSAEAVLAGGTKDDLAKYVTTYLDSFSTKVSSFKFAPWQPSAVLVGPDKSHYIFRVCEASPAHAPAGMDEPREQTVNGEPLHTIRDRVIYDWKLAKGYDLAKAEAAKLKTKAEAVGLEDAAAAFGRPLVPTESISNELIGERMEYGTPLVPPLKISAESGRQLFGGALDLLISPQDTAHPLSVLDLNYDATAVVVELLSSQPSPRGYSMPSAQADEMDAANLKMAWCDPAAVRARVGYVPEKSEGGKSSP